MPDLSKISGNPTAWIHDNYQHLMAIEDPEELKNTVLRGVQPLVGHGLSVGNFRKLQLRLAQAAERSLFALKKAISDYLLAGIDPGLRVGSVSPVHEGVLRVIDDPQLAVSSMLDVELNPEQARLVSLVESCGLPVGLCEAEDRQDLPYGEGVAELLTKALKPGLPVVIAGQRFVLRGSSPVYSRESEGAFFYTTMGIPGGQKVTLEVQVTPVAQQ